MAHLRHRPMELPTRTTKPQLRAPTPTTPRGPPAACVLAGTPRRKWLLWAGPVVGLAVGGYLLAPAVKTALDTVSTDDAYVNGHVTLRGPPGPRPGDPRPGRRPTTG